MEFLIGRSVHHGQVPAAMALTVALGGINHRARLTNCKSTILALPQTLVVEGITRLTSSADMSSLLQELVRRRASRTTNTITRHASQADGGGAVHAGAHGLVIVIIRADHAQIVLRTENRVPLL